MTTCSFYASSIALRAVPVDKRERAREYPDRLSGQRTGRTTDKETPMAAIDPVCGMSVEESDAPDKLDHDGTTYYFCSSDCRQEFEANPGDYTS